MDWTLLLQRLLGMVEEREAQAEAGRQADLEIIAILKMISRLQATGSLSSGWSKILYLILNYLRLTTGILDFRHA